MCLCICSPVAEIVPSSEQEILTACGQLSDVSVYGTELQLVQYIVQFAVSSCGLYTEGSLFCTRSVHSVGQEPMNYAGPRRQHCSALQQ
jgi:hypothetical protein